MKRPVIIVLIVLAVVVLAFFYANSGKKSYKWFENYSANSDQPFGTLFIHELVKSYARDGFVHNSKKPLDALLDSASVKESSVYMFVGYNWSADSVETEAMLRYLAVGNDAFIICNSPSDRLLKLLNKSECTDTLSFQNEWKTTVKANFYHRGFAVLKPYSFTHTVKDKDRNYQWRYLDGNALCDSASSIVPLGFYDDDYVNFFKMPHGKGNLYIHTTPLVFTNYFMVRERATEYASAVLSHSAHRRFIWDDRKQGLSFRRNSSTYNNPLYYIMEQPALRYAWWLLVAIGLLYVVFAGKRQQRFIPVLEKKANASLAFMKMVSSLHFREKNHGDMARKKMKFFLHTVRTRYGLQTHTINDQFIEKLSVKAQVSKADVELIFNQYRIIENFQDIDSAPLDNLYNAIQNFYNKAK